VPYSVDINWMLDDLVARIPQIEKAVVLTRDGLATGASGVLVQEDAERLAALAAGFLGLARGAATYLISYGVRQVIVEMAGSYLFITAAGENGCVAVVASSLTRRRCSSSASVRTFPRLGVWRSAAERPELRGT